LGRHRASGVGKRLESALGHSDKTESTILLEALEALDATILVEDRGSAKAEHLSPGLTIFTDGSRVDSGAAGYAMAWQNGQHWLGIKVQMGYNRDAFDAECAALVTALEVAARRQTTQARVTFFTAVQAAIR
jgi:hypothetical protein